MYKTILSKVLFGPDEIMDLKGLKKRAKHMLSFMSNQEKAAGNR